MKKLGPEHPDVGDTYYNMADLFNKQEDWSEALKYYESSLSIFIKVYGDDQSKVLDCQEQITDVKWKQNGGRSKDFGHTKKMCEHTQIIRKG